MLNARLYGIARSGILPDVTCEYDSAPCLPADKLTSMPRGCWCHHDLRIVSASEILLRASAPLAPKQETHARIRSLEIDLAIIAASLPSIMPLLARWRRSRGTTLIPQHNRAPTPKPKRAPRDPFRITGGSSRRDVESRVDGSETHPPFGGNDLKEYPSHDGSDTVLPLNVVELKM